MRKSIISAILILLSCVYCSAQEPLEGIPYFLPKTAVQIKLLIEKTTFQPGKYAEYAGKYMKEQVPQEPSAQYRIIKTGFFSIGLPDSSKYYVAQIDKKHSIVRISRDENGVLMAVNAEPRVMEHPQPFVPSPQPKPIDASQYLTGDMIAAGSNFKTAELIAQEIYDTRDSKNQINRGEADFMPKDGEQLRIMLRNLDMQEKALLTFFEGTTSTDTLEKTITLIPMDETQRQLLFRFSSKLGVVDNDDLSGVPYYISVENQQVIEKLPAEFQNGKKKDNVQINVSLPGKIRVTLYKEEKTISSFETYAAQFGQTENISGKLFGKKFTIRIVLDPRTGNIISIEKVSLD